MTRQLGRFLALAIASVAACASPTEGGPESSEAAQTTDEWKLEAWKVASLRDPGQWSPAGGALVSRMSNERIILVFSNPGAYPYADYAAGAAAVNALVAPITTGKLQSELTRGDIDKAFGSVTTSVPWDTRVHTTPVVCGDASTTPATAGTAVFRLYPKGSTRADQDFRDVVSFDAEQDNEPEESAVGKFASFTKGVEAEVFMPNGLRLFYSLEPRVPGSSTDHWTLRIVDAMCFVAAQRR